MLIEHFLLHFLHLTFSIASLKKAIFFSEIPWNLTIEMVWHSWINNTTAIHCEYDLLLLQLYARTHAARNDTLLRERTGSNIA